MALRIQLRNDSPKLRYLILGQFKKPRYENMAKTICQNVANFELQENITSDIFYFL